MSSSVLSPLVFRGGRTAKNRVALAAMTNQQSHDDGTLSDDELAWLGRRVDGGFGIITTCASHVAKDGQGWSGELGCFDDRHVPSLRRIADRCHAANALAITQIFHGGLRADAKLTGERPWSASDGENHRAATEADLARVIDQFGDAALRCHAAGMDGVELHGAHGYLLGQFVSTIENRRADGWGGSLLGRTRLMREAVRAVRTRVPAPFLVGIRISPEDFGNAKGLDLDENLQLAQWLVEEGIDFLHVSIWDVQRNSKKRPEEHVIPQFRAVLPSDVRLFAAGKIWTREDAERVLSLGADVVALGRSAINNPDWPTRITDPTWEPALPPLAPDELVARGLSPKFVGYMRNWKNFVRD